LPEGRLEREDEQVAVDELENRQLKFGPELVGIASDLCVRLDDFKPPSLLKNSKRLPVLLLPQCEPPSVDYTGT